MRIEQLPVITASARGAGGIGSFQQSATHSRTLPSMSCSPKAFAGKLPTGAGAGVTRFGHARTTGPMTAGLAAAFRRFGFASEEEAVPALE